MTDNEMIIQEYITFKMQPANDNTSDALFASSRGVSFDTLKKLLKETKIDYRTEIVNQRRKTYAERMLKVDEALFIKAQGGNIAAIELIYKRWDGWSDKLIDASQHQHFTFIDLVKKHGAPTHKAGNRFAGNEV